MWLPQQSEFTKALWTRQVTYIICDYVGLYLSIYILYMRFKWDPSIETKSYRRRRYPSSTEIWGSKGAHKNWGFGVLFRKKIQRKIRRNHHFMWWKMRFFCYNCGISVVFFYNNNNDRPPSTRPQGQLLSFLPRAMVPQRTARRRDFVSGGNRWTKQFQWSTEWLFLRMVNQWLLPQIR